MTYDPLKGTGWNVPEATSAWTGSMDRARQEGPKWNLRGQPGSWHWSYFDFRPYRGIVQIKPDGFHWATFDYDTGTTLHSGVTTSLFVAYQSVVRNQVVTRTIVRNRAVQALVSIGVASAEAGPAVDQARKDSTMVVVMFDGGCTSVTWRNDAWVVPAE
jgi:hypothetical protein